MRPALLLAAALPRAAAEDDAWLRRSGMLRGGPTTLRPGAWPAGASFAGVFSDHAVLQRAPARATVYGVVIGTGELRAGSLQVQVSVQEHGAAARAGYQAAAEHVEVVNGSYARWKARLAAAPAGGEYTVGVSCAGCQNTTQRVLRDVTFGDVWFCSGQSNMWLPVHFSYSRNKTYDAIRAGRYRNIRMHAMQRNQQPDDAWPHYDPYIAPKPGPWDNFGAIQNGPWLLADVGTYPCDDGRPLSECSPGRSSDEWYNNTVDTFSAACWYFAEHLTDLSEARGETPVPFGLIESNWGGTMVEMWQPNASLNAQACRNATGGAYAPSQLGRWDIAAGALWNGMVLPFVNMTIKGALWYQGENNVFQCAGGRSAPLGDPSACGRTEEGTGYGCFMRNLVETWRAEWSSGPASDGTTDPLFPFGIVSLAGGTSEGFGNNMPAFRLAQAGGTGLLPTPGMPNTFTAQAYDLGDAGDGDAAKANRYDGMGAYSCERGYAPYTSFFMGGIHPRPKRQVGVRLAQAARALVYGDTESPWTGPVLADCAVTGSGLTLTFNATLLGPRDALAVRGSAVRYPISLELLARAGGGAAALDALIATNADALYTSPLEVQYGGAAGDLAGGTWLPAQLRTLCPHGGHKNTGHGGVEGNAACSINVTTGARAPGWNVAQAALPLGPLNATQVTAVRYAFRDDPCCPSIDRGVVPCPPASCPIQGYNSTLPAVPFVAEIRDGRCAWISTAGGAPGR